MIRNLEKNDIKECLNVIKSSFKTVAEDLNLTKENAPTNPAFLSIEALNNAINNGTEYFVLETESGLAGSIALEQSGKDKSIYFIERLAVIPDERHKGLGKKLLDFAFNQVKEKNGKSISIGIINENTVLKNWYKKYGFIETGIKIFDHLPFTVCFMEKNV